MLALFQGDNVLMNMNMLAGIKFKINTEKIVDVQNLHTLKQTALGPEL
jgi:hypothetical protein